MARKHSDLVDEAIKSMALDLDERGVPRFNASQIWRALADGSSPLQQPHEMPKRTVQHKVATFRRESNIQVDLLQGRDEVDAADSAQRALLRTALAEVERYRERGRQAKLTASEAAEMEKWSKLIWEIRRGFSKLKTGSRSASNQANAGEHKGRTLTPQSTLQRLASTSNGSD